MTFLLLVGVTAPLSPTWILTSVRISTPQHNIYTAYTGTKARVNRWCSLAAGSLAQRYNVQFSGTVQVMKAVSSHMVLTFCSRSDYNRYSVLMSRARHLPPSDLRSVNKMLTRRGLQQGQVKEMCKGAAASARGRLAAVTLLLVAKFLITWP